MLCNRSWLPDLVGRRLYPGSVRLEVLHPGMHDLQKTQSDSNNNGLVLRLTYGRFSVLLTGDLQSEGEAALLAGEGLPLQSTVLKVAHHGANRPPLSAGWTQSGRSSP
jgi:competence protein ComEC